MDKTNWNCWNNIENIYLIAFLYVKLRYRNIKKKKKKKNGADGVL